MLGATFCILTGIVLGYVIGFEAAEEKRRKDDKRGDG